MLVCEELFLLLTTTEGTAEPWVSNQDKALSGALLIDLVTSGQVTFSGKGKDPRVVAAADDSAGDSDTSEPVLDFGLDALRSHKSYRASTVVAASWFSPRKAIARHLADLGVVEIQGEKLLGLVPERYPASDTSLESSIRERLAGVLQGNRTASPEDIAILSLLDQIGASGRVLAKESGDLSGRALRNRIKEIMASGFEGDASLMAVRKAIDSLQAAISGAAIGSIG